MTPTKFGEEHVERLTRQEELILDVTIGISEAMDDRGVTKAELARRLDRTPSFVSQLLAGSRNLTLRTISDVAAAISLRPSFVLSPESRMAVSVMPVERRQSQRAPPVDRSALGGGLEKWIGRWTCPLVGGHGIAGIRASGAR